MKKIIIKSLIGLSFVLPVVAGTIGETVLSTSSPFYVGAYGGFGTVSGGFKQDGNVVQGRLSIGSHAKEYRALMLGAELGLQSGNSMRLNANSDLINAAGGLPIQATLKPWLDLLFTVKGPFASDNSLFYVLKGGIAFRQLQLENRSSTQDSLSTVNGEFQAGLGYNLTGHVMLTAFYQGIYSAPNAGVRLDAVNDVILAHIPTQQAGFLGVEYSFF
jgi:hypothetical protein